MIENKPTQKNRILNRLKEENGNWVNGQVFEREMGITQFHTRIWELQKADYEIEASSFKDEHGFKSYRLKDEPEDEPVVVQDIVPPTYTPRPATAEEVAKRYDELGM